MAETLAGSSNLLDTGQESSGWYKRQWKQEKRSEAVKDSLNRLLLGTAKEAKAKLSGMPAGGAEKLMAMEQAERRESEGVAKLLAEAKPLGSASGKLQQLLKKLAPAGGGQERLLPGGAQMPALRLQLPVKQNDGLKMKMGRSGKSKAKKVPLGMKSNPIAERSGNAKATKYSYFAVEKFFETVCGRLVVKRRSLGSHKDGRKQWSKGGSARGKDTASYKAKCSAEEEPWYPLDVVDEEANELPICYAKVRKALGAIAQRPPLC